MFEFGPNIEFWHSESYFDIQTGPNIEFWHSKYFFWHSNSGRISHFDIRNDILTFELRPIITFWHSKSYFDIRIGPNIRFWHSISGRYLFWHLKSYFDIRNRAEYRIFNIRNPILTFEFGPSIEIWHSNWGRISNFDIRNSILTFKFGPNIAFWHSKSYFDIRIRAKYRILIFEPLIKQSNWGRISNFDIHNPILTFEFGPNIRFLHSLSFFAIRTGPQNRILTFEILFWHSNLGRISQILTFELRQNITFWHSKSYLTFEFGLNIGLWHSKSYFDIQIRAE